MAKRKKLNKKVVVLLAVAGFAVLSLAVAYVFTKLPKDVEAIEARGDAASKEKKYADAAKAYGDAIAISPTADRYVKYAQVKNAWRMSPGLSQTERDKHWQDALGSLDKAILKDPKHEPALRAQMEMYWEIGQERADSQKRFIESATRLLELKPDDAETYYRRGSLRRKIAALMPGETLEGAKQDLGKAVELQPEKDEYWAGLIGLMVEIGDKERAKSLLAEAKRFVKDSPRLHLLHAESLQRMGGQEAEVLQELQQAVVVGAPKGDATGHGALALYYLRKGDLDKALQTAEEGLVVDAASMDLYALLADIYVRQRAPEKSIEVLRKGQAVIAERIAKAGQDALAQGRLEDKQLLLTYMLCDRLLDLVGREGQDKDKIFTEVQECVARLEKIYPGHPRGQKLAGRMALARGDRAEATRLLKLAHEGMGKRDVGTAMALANLYKVEGNPGLVDEILNDIRAIPGYANHPGVLLAQAEQQIRYGNYERASALITKVLQIDPDNAEAKAMQAIATSSNRMPSSVDLSTRNLELLVARINSLWAGGDRDQALRMAEDLYRRQPDNKILLQYLLRLYMAADQTAKAEDLLKRAIAKNPEDKQLAASLTLMQEKDPQKRYAMSLDLVAQDKTPLEAALAKMNVAALHNKPEDYKTFLDEATALDPNASGVVEGWLRHAINAQDWALADKYAIKAGELDLDGLRGQLIKAQLAALQNRHQEVVDVLSAVVGQHPNNKQAGLLLAESYMQLQQYAKAEEVFRALAKNDPGLPNAAIGMLRVKEAQNDPTDYAEWLDRAYRLAPQHPYVQQKRLDFQQDRSENLAEVMAKREAHLAANPDDLGNRFRLAQLYERAKRFDKAEEMYAYIYTKAADKLPAADLLANFLDRMGRSIDAENVLTKLIQDSSGETQVGAKIAYAFFHARHDRAKAAELFEAVAAETPNNARVHYARSQFYARGNEFAKAADALDTYIRLDPKAAPFEKDLVRYLIDSQQYERAATRLDRMHAADPADAEVLTLMAVLSMRKNELDKADKLFAQAMEANAKFAPAYLYRANFHLLRRDLLKARQDLEEARKLSNDPRASLQLAEVLMMLDKPAEAEVVVRGMLSGNPTYEPALRMLIGVYMRTRQYSTLESTLADARKAYPQEPYYLLAEAEMWQARGESAKAIDAIDRAYNLDTKNLNVLRSYLLALLNAKQPAKALTLADAAKTQPGFEPWGSAVRGRALAGINKAAEADDLFGVAIKSCPPAQLPFVLEQVRLAYPDKQGLDKMERWVLEGRPADVQAQLALAAAHMAAAQPAKALEAAQRVSDLAKTPAERGAVSMQLGAAYYELGQYAQAEAAYLEAIKHRPSDAQSLNNLAYLYAENMDRPADGVKYGEKAAALRPEDANVLDTYGWSLAKAKDFAKAEEVLSRSIQLNPTLPILHYHLGWVYESQGRADEARRSYRRAFEMVRGSESDPLRAVIEKALDRMQAAARSEER